MNNKTVQIFEFRLFLALFGQVHLRNQKRYMKSIDWLPEALSALNSREKRVNIGYKISEISEFGPILDTFPK